MLLFDYYDNADEDQNLEMGLLTVDYFIVSTDAASVTVKPYVGFNVGYMNYESSFIDQSGLMYGGQGGIVANVSDKVDIDIAYRYSLGYDTVDLDHFGVLMLGVNYLY
jgi:opacity protein-like surface antigen